MLIESNNLNLKCQRFTASGCRDIGIRKLVFVAKTQFLCSAYTLNRGGEGQGVIGPLEYHKFNKLNKGVGARNFIRISCHIILSNKKFKRYCQNNAKYN